jgi:predicted DNA-binding ribbon-helix-helix protein
MSLVKKRSLRIAGHNTSVSLEEPFWRLLTRVAQAEGLSIPAYVERIDAARARVNLSSAIRVHLMEWMMAKANINVS